MVMKQSQWTIAVLVLAAMVFLVTFVMNYLGFARFRPAQQATREAREVRFFWRGVPLVGTSGIETEVRAPGYQDFWFRNDHPEPVTLGLKRTNCKCTAVEVFLLDEEGQRRLVQDALALVGTGSLGLTPLLALQALAFQQIHLSATGPTELLREKDSMDVPAGAVGWVRMRWKGERVGRQTLAIELWMDSKENGKIAGLATRLRFHEPLRVRPTLALGLLREEDLTPGITRDIICWSSTRPSLRLEVSAARPRGNLASDPFSVGNPVALTSAELDKLEQDNNAEQGGGDLLEGQVLCAFRIPVTLHAVAPDGKTPFDIGPFRRRITLSSPDLSTEPRHVAVTGRVRGPIEIGNGEDGGEVNFSDFPRRKGRKEAIALQSDVPGMSLAFDRQRTPKFLSARVGKPEKIGDGRQAWKVDVEVLPGEASGVFPRREDPAYEDSAVYLEARVPGKPARSVRIGVRGTANES
jgi:hypothetical protein